MKIEEDEVVVTDPPIGYKMRRVRGVVGGKQEQIAIELGVTQQCISEWEKSTSIKKSTLNKYAKAIGVDPESIINFNDNQPMNVFNNCEMQLSNSNMNNNGGSPQISFQLPPELLDTLNKVLLAWHEKMNK